MVLTRRTLIAASGAAAGALPMFAIAESNPIKIGWLAALTGPSSAPSQGVDRGVQLAAKSLNASGGVNGRMIEIVTRDTQGDPTKAVNATQEMINSEKVHAIWGPSNSGEALATTPIMARANMPTMHPCVVDSLINVARFPNAFRLAPAQEQWDAAVREYCLKSLKTHKVAVIGDTTGAGVAIAKASAAAFKADGADVVYTATIDQSQPDVSPDLLRARNAGAEAIVVWTVSTGLEARMMNTRAAMGWDVPFVGHPSLSSGGIAGMLDKPGSWDKVYAVGSRSCSFGADGKLPPHSAAFVDMVRGKVSLQDTLLWWVMVGFDAVTLFANAVRQTGSSEHADIIGNLNRLDKYPGYYGTYTFTPKDHDGYPNRDVVMSEASTAKDGAFRIAPGYGA